MSDAPHVSVLIPTYNGEEFVGDAIESVLAQTFDDFELLIVDDASTDDTIGVAESYDDDRIVVHRSEENLGIARNMNRAVGLADGELLAFLDQDDLWKAEKLKRHVDAHSASGAAVVYSNVDIVTLTDRRIERVRPPRPEPAGESLVRQLYVSLNFIRTFSGVTIQRSAWEDVNGLDTDLTTSADYDLYLRLAENHEFERVDQTLVVKRQHAENTSGDYETLYEDINYILSKTRQRRPELDPLSSEESREYGFQRAFGAYRAREYGEAMAHCRTSLANGVQLRTLALYLFSMLDAWTGGFRVGSKLYRLYRIGKALGS